VGEMKQRMLRGELYRFDDPELAADYARAQALLERYNTTRQDEQDLRDTLLRDLLGEMGDGVVIRPSSLRYCHKPWFQAQFCRDTGSARQSSGARCRASRALLWRGSRTAACITELRE